MMHLEKPWLTTTGKRKGSKKWSSAEQKRKNLQLETEWQDLKTRTMINISKKPEFSNKLPKLVPPPGRELVKYPSRDSGIGNATKKPPSVYTGHAVLGITIVHKSCLQPVFNTQAAVDAANMRR